MGDTLADLLREAGIDYSRPAALQQQAPIPYRNVRPPRPLPRTMRPPEERVRDPNRSVRVQAAAELAPPDIDLGRALTQAPAAMGEDRRHYVSQLRRGEFPDAVRELPGDVTGLNSISRGVTDFMGGDVRGGIINTGLGGLTAATLGVGPRLAPRGVPRVVPEPLPRLPTPPPREIGRASDGSVLPIRPAQPFRQSFVGGSRDLNEAAGMQAPVFDLPFYRPDWATMPRDPMGQMEWLQQQRTALVARQAAYEDRILPFRPQAGDRLSHRQMIDHAEQISRAVNAVDRRLDELRASQGLPTRLDEAFREGRELAADGKVNSSLLRLPRSGNVVPPGGSTPPTSITARPVPPPRAGLRSPNAIPESGVFANAGGRRGIRAYHGSPHDFDRFSLDRIGTGEGAQAYGHGLYFAENEGVARSYRHSLAGGPRGLEVGIGGRTAYDDLAPNERGAYQELWARLSPYNITPENAADIMARTQTSIERTLANHRAGHLTGDMALRPYDVERLESALDLLRRNEVSLSPPHTPGRMYEVNINAAPEDFLDWDAPLGNQPEPLRRALGWTPDAEAAYRSVDKADVDALMAALEGDASNYRSARLPVPRGVPPLSMTGADIVKGHSSPVRYNSEADTSARLRSAGIPGIRYLDQGSRAAGEGSRNYVVFDANLIEILRKYGLAGLGVGAAAGAGAQQNAPGL